MTQNETTQERAPRIQPNQALLTLWSRLKDSTAARHEYETSDDTVRNMVNVWAQLEAEEQQEALQIFEGDLPRAEA